MTGCNAEAETPVEPVVTEAAETPTEIPTEVPSPTPEPGKVVLVVTQNDDLIASQMMRETLAELAAERDLLFEEKASLNPVEITPGWKVVVFLQQPENLNDLIHAAPQTQFVVPSWTDMEYVPNLNVIRYRPERQAFIAGYIAVMVAPDWRAAGLLISDTSIGVQMQEAFINGGKYYCGICNPYFPPAVRFPDSRIGPAASDVSAWQYAVDEMDKNILEVVYVDGAIANAQLLNHIASKDVFMMGNQSPIQEIRSRWITTLDYDLTESVRKIWPDLMVGFGGQTVDATIALTETNEEILSIGRQRLVEETIDALEIGQIYPFSIPIE
jgi:hypothetical protein